MRSLLLSWLFATLSCNLLIAQETIRWPQFRGLNGKAVAPEGEKYPVEFGPKKNVLWKMPLPEGHSSPCIWGDAIFLTSYQPEGKKLETICLDRQSGKIRWRRTAPATKIERVNKVNSPASSTPAADGKYVYSYFGSYGLICYDFDGKEIWKQPLPTPRTIFGAGTSPVVAGNIVLLNAQGKDLHLMAFNKADGRVLWTTKGNPFPSNYPTPFIWENQGTKEVIIPGKGGLLAFDLKDGEKRWWIPGLSPEVASSPAIGDGLLFVASHLPGGDPDMRMKLPSWEELTKDDANKDKKMARNEFPRDRLIFSRGGKEGVGDLRLHMMFWLYDADDNNYVDEKEWRAMLTQPFTNSLLAIRPGGTRNIKETHIAWKVKRGVPEVPSPLYYRGRVYMVRNGGVLTCVNAKTGEPVFPRTRIGRGGLYYASPVAGDGKVYFCSDEGLVTVIKASDKFEILAQVDFKEIIRATPALVDNKIYLRTGENLYALGEAK